jgi:transcription initiation factor TFIIB
MATRDIYERGFDEDDGRTIQGPCPDCEGRLRTDSGETACTVCGLVIEGRHFDFEEPPAEISDTLGRDRIGAPLTERRHDRGLSSEIGFGTDAKGNTLSGKKRRQLGRLRREHGRARWGSKAERNLGIGLTEISRMGSALELPKSLPDEACRHFRQAQEADLLRGRSIEAVASASVYAACREDGRVETIADVAEVSRVSRPAIKNAYNVMNRELGLAVQPRAPAAFVPRLCSDLGLDRHVGRETCELAGRATAAGIGIGCQPVGVAAGCLAVVIEDGGIGVTQSELAGVADVSIATVRARRDQLRPELDR